MSEEHVKSMFLGIAEVVSVKLIKNQNNYRSTPNGVGFGFVEFPSHEIAKSIFTTLNGAPVPNSQGKVFKLNWATHGGGATSSTSSHSQTRAVDQSTH